ncbi:MAG: hypothetical protein HN416_17210, partial [Nitrospina sp.]|nr:hypothetical protein [Nitrospina sp.]
AAGASSAGAAAGAQETRTRANNTITDKNAFFFIFFNSFKVDCDFSSKYSLIFQIYFPIAPPVKFIFISSHSNKEEQSPGYFCFMTSVFMIVAICFGVSSIY